jgi:peptidoglycan/LPS O-acetylase OafA/YrhL
MYLIVLFHADVAWAEGTFIAVNLFFVLSGYLVTNVILSEMDRTGTLRLGTFYARRIRRLLPAALAAIVGISLLFLLVFPVVRRLPLVGDAQSALLYVANWRFIQQGNDYFATDVDKSPFLHFWTLGIEEQFYVGFPLLILLLHRSARKWALFAGLSAVFVLSLGAQLYWARVDELHAYFGTDARLYQLVAGALLAVALRNWPVRLSARASGLTAGAGMAGFLLLSFALDGLSQSLRGIFGTLACVLLIAGLMLAENQPLGRVLSRRTPVYLGKISYSTYLWHWPAILVIKEVLEIGPVPVAVIAAVVATAMAAASNEVLEMPVRTTGILDRFRWRTVLVGVCSSALVAATVVPVILENDRQPALVSAKQSAPRQAPLPEATERKLQGTRAQSEPTRGEADQAKGAPPAAVPDDVDWKQIDRNKGEDYTCAATAPQECTVVDGTGPHIVVIGDSHARMLSEMFKDLAEDHDLKLSMNTVGACPWQEDLTNRQATKALQQECTEARVGWYGEVLPRLEPDLVILTSFPRAAGAPGLELREGSDDSMERAVLRATKRTLDKIDEVSPRTLIIETVVTPRTFSPNGCLTSTSDPTECSIVIPAKNRKVDAYYIAAAALSPSRFTVDLNPAFCPSAPRCDAVVDGHVVWRDRHHLAPSYAAAQRDRAWKLILDTGVLDDVSSS